MFKIGKNGNIWLELNSGPEAGEAGEFNLDSLEACITQFYADYF